MSRRFQFLLIQPALINYDQLEWGLISYLFAFLAGLQRRLNASLGSSLPVGVTFAFRNDADVRYPDSTKAWYSINGLLNTADTWLLSGYEFLSGSKPHRWI